LLPPLAMWTAFPPSDYYGGSVPPGGHQPTTSLPAPSLAGWEEGGRRAVPTFTTRPVDGIGVQLFLGSLATRTPQPFLVASKSAEP
jgi:hypothetical protein